MYIELLPNHSILHSPLFLSRIPLIKIAREPNGTKRCGAINTAKPAHLYQEHILVTKDLED